jgi:hypothetical protein
MYHLPGGTLPSDIQLVVGRIERKGPRMYSHRSSLIQKISTTRHAPSTRGLQRLSVVASIIAACGSTHAQLSFWNSPADGNWYDTLAWSPFSPSSTTDAQLGWTGPYTVTVSPGIASCRSLTISNPQAVLQVANTISSLRSELWTYGDISNSGTILIGAPGAEHTALLSINGPTTLSGSGVLRLAQQTPTQAVTLSSYFGLGWPFTHAAGHRIEGAGAIRVLLVNDGLIDANVPEREIAFESALPIQNNSVIRASNGGQINLRQGNGDFGFTQGPSGELRAGNNSTLLLQSAGNQGLSGGRITTIGTGIAFVNAQGFPIQNIRITSGSELRIGNNNGIHVGPAGLTNDGLLRATGAFIASNFAQSATLHGSGRLQLEAGYFGKFLDGASYTIINAPGHTIAGHGDIKANFTNRGSVVADRNGQTSGPTDLRLTNTPKFNEGLMSASGGGNLVIENNVTVSQSATGVIHAFDGSSIQLIRATIIGGTLSSSGTGVLVGLGDADALDGVTIAPGSSLMINRCSELIAGVNGIKNHGTITIGSGSCGASFANLRGLSGASVTGSGQILLNANQGGFGSAVLRGDGSPSLPLVIGSDQTISGTGRFTGSIRIQGTLAPSQTINASGPIGAIECAAGPTGASLAFTATSTFECDLASPSSFDRIQGSGAISLAGTLRLSLLNSFVPAEQDSFDIIVGSSVTGTFNSIIVDPQPPSGTLRVTYLSDRVRVTPCYTDFNRDGSSDFFDYLDFVAALDAGTADFNNDGIVDFFDYLDFVNAFAFDC